MTNDEMERRTAEVRRLLKAAGGTGRGRGRGYGEAARSAAIDHARLLVARGDSVGSTAEALGIHAATLSAWLSRTTERAPGAFARVEVAASEPRRDSSRAGALALELPGGARIVGLDVTAAVALIRALG